MQGLNLRLGAEEIYSNKGWVYLSCFCRLKLLLNKVLYRVSCIMFPIRITQARRKDLEERVQSTRIHRFYVTGSGGNHVESRTSEPISTSKLKFKKEGLATS